MKPIRIMDLFTNALSDFRVFDPTSDIIDRHVERTEKGLEYSISLFRANGPPKVTLKGKALSISVPTEDGMVNIVSRIENPPDPGEIIAKKKDGELKIFVPHPEDDSGGVNIPIE